MSGKALIAGRGRKPKIQKTAKNDVVTNTFFDVLKDVAPPADLNEDGKKLWIIIIKQLTSQQVLYTTDVVVLENFCIAYQNRRLAQKGINEYGLYVASPSGAISKNPAFSILNESLRQLATFGAMLGLDPASRQRVITTAEKVEDNPFFDLLK